MQIKTTMRFHLTSVRMAVIDKSTNNKCWQRCGEKGTLAHFWWECRWVQPLWKKFWSYLKELKIELSYDLVILLLENYQKKPPKTNFNSKEHIYPYVHCSIIYNNPDLEAAQVSISR